MKPLTLVIGTLAVLGLAAPIASAQTLTPERVQYALDMTDRRIQQAEMVLAGVNNDPARAELDLAISIQAQAKSVFASAGGDLRLLQRTVSLTLEARGHADRAIAIVKGLPDPDRVRVQLERTREVIDRARQAIEECNTERARNMLRVGIEMQTRAEAAFGEGRLLAALQLTMSARERVLTALRMCNAQENQHDRAEQVLRRTNEIILRAQDIVAEHQDEHAREALGRAQQLDPRDHAAPYEAGLLAQQAGELDAALEGFERSARSRPDFVAAPFAAGIVHAERKDWLRAAACFRRVLELRPGEALALLHLALVLAREGDHAAAEATFVDAMSRHPRDAAIARAYGQYCASRGEFGRAAESFARVLRLDPSDAALPMFLAQCELLSGRWAEGWAAYASREPRRQFERAAVARGAPYAVPPIARVRGQTLTLVGEQGLGDTLFFLRWAPRLREAGARLRFAGDERLHAILGRTGLFEAFAADASDGGGSAVLAGDLPTMFPALDPFTMAPLRIAPLPDRVAKWKEALEAAGPRPWIGVQWRAGTPKEAQATALSKNAPLEPLFAALAPSGGTLLAIQRSPRPGEIEKAAQAARRAVHDYSRVNEDLEDVLALVSLLDRHVAVSSTTLHLTAAAASTADVLVPFPPEWRWRAQGDSPWFPGFRLHRQRMDGDWAQALAAAARGPQASGLQ